MILMYRTSPVRRPGSFDPKKFLCTVDSGRRIVSFGKNETIFLQGSSADDVFYILNGRVKLTVVAKSGKEATIGIRSEGDFFGKGALAGQRLRKHSANAMTTCSVMRIAKQAMTEVLHREHAFSDMFVDYLLSMNTRYEADLVDQLFNASEKRLARMLLLLAHFGEQGKAEAVIPKITQETLAEMVGTTRARVSFFMNRFRKVGLIDYDRRSLQVHKSLLDVVLHDEVPANSTLDLRAGLRT
jgi:CRP/FNR family transcriptional regulator, cyclic AMP receptor protein